MGRATLTAFVLLCAFGAAAPVSAAPQPRPPAAAEQRPREEAAKPQQSAASQQPARGKRRNSYAFCNRESHKRNLRGGARRRFLIRCKLGYEQRQPSRPSEPSGRRS